MSLRLLFSITIVNTEPLKPAVGVAVVAVRSQLCAGVPEPDEAPVDEPPPAPPQAAIPRTSTANFRIEPPCPNNMGRGGRMRNRRLSQCALREPPITDL